MPPPAEFPSAVNERFLAGTVVVIPALNEAPCIAGTVRYWRERGVALVRVVDNGSTDFTGVWAHAAGAEVRVEPRRGYGAAAWTGTRDLPAKIDWILFSAADGSDRLDPASAAAFQREIDAGATLVLGERVTRASSRRWLSPVQRFGNALTCCLIALAWGRRFRDMGSLRVIRREAFERLALRDRAFGWNVEMQVRALEERLRMVEVPVDYFPRAGGDSKISGSFRGVLRAGWGILAMVARLRRECDHSGETLVAPYARRNQPARHESGMDQAAVGPSGMRAAVTLK